MASARAGETRLAAPSFEDFLVKTHFEEWFELFLGEGMNWSGLTVIQRDYVLNLGGCLD